MSGLHSLLFCKQPLPWLPIRLAVTLMLTIALSTATLAQTFTGPEDPCPATSGIGEEYTYWDDVQYTTVTWQVTGGGVYVSGSGLSRFYRWTGDGTLTVQLRNSAGNVVSQGTKVIVVRLPGTLSQPGSVCAGGTVNITSTDYGSSTSFQWAYSTDGTNFTSLGTGGPTLTHTPTATTWYRRYPTGCKPAQLSNTVQVTYYTPSVGGSISLTSAGSFCVSPSGNATASFVGSGNSPTVNGWQVRTRDGAGGSWSGWSYYSTANSTTSSYTALQPASGSMERYYQFQMMSSNGICAVVPSSFIEVPVYPTAVGGTLAGITAQHCGNSNVNLSVSGNWGPAGEYQVSTQVNGGSWSAWQATPASVSLTTTSPNYTSYKFRWMSSSAQCGTDYSNEVSTTVYPAVNSGSVSLTSASTFCLNAGSSATASFTASGYVHSISGWRVRTRDGAGGWSAWSTFSASSASSMTYSVQPATAYVERSYEFQPEISSGICTKLYPTPVLVVAYPLPVGGTIGAVSASFCNNGTANLSVTGTQGTGGYFQKREQNGAGGWGSWSTTSSSVSLSTNGSQPRYYEFQWVSTSPSCTASGSSVASTVVYPASSVSPLTLTSSSSFCASGTVNLSLSSFVGALQWQSRYMDGPTGSWTSWVTFSTAASLVNSTAVSAGATLTRSYQFQVIAQSGTCAAAPSNTVSATVYPSPSATVPSISPGTEYFTSSPALTLSGSGVGTISYEQSINGTTWSAVAANPVSPISVSTLFRTKSVSGPCTPVFSAPAPVNIYPNPVITVNGALQIPVGGSTTLSVQSTFFSYQWTKDGADISGATGYTYVVTQPGTYNVRVKATGTSPTATALPKTVESSLLNQPLDINFKVVTNFYKQGMAAGINPYLLSATEVNQNITYMDGYGRTLQNISVGASPGRKDVVQPMQYDKYGQNEYQFMAYTTGSIDGRFRPNAVQPSGLSYSASEHYTFYTVGGNGLPSDSEPRARSLFEDSPLGRLIEQGAPGSAWQTGSGHAVSQVMRTNHSAFTDAALKNIKRWTTAGPGANYGDNQLLIATTIDENGNSVWTFSDKLGRTVLKRVQLDDVQEGVTTPFLETYYVYDDRGNLALQIPPKAVAKINGGTSWTTTFRDEWCFVYTYDVRNRLVEKKVPGSGLMYYAYDPLDRLVLTQDATLRASNKWVFIKYDAKNRPVMTGLYTNTTHTTRTAVQTNVLDPLYATGVWYEERGSASHGYTNQSFPTANAPTGSLEILSVNYFDNYDFDNNGTADYSYTAQNLSGESSQAPSAFDLPTGSKRLQLGTANWLYTYAFYDKYGRTIQVRSNNHLNLALTNLQTYVFDFGGKLQLSKNTHTGSGGTTVTVTNRYKYDHAGRILRVYQRNNSDAEQVLAAYVYNELGQLMEKNIHCKTCHEDVATAGQPNGAYGDVVARSGYSASETKLIANSLVQLLPGYATPAGASVNMRIATPSADFTAATGGDFMQSIDYRYNIRGWLTHINNAALSNDGTTNNDANDYFGMELNYNTVASGISNTAQYNGNISAITWKGMGESAGNAGKRSYKYTYDKSDRLRTSTFQAYGTAAWDKEANTLNENMSYDANGNILSLARNRNQRGNSGLTVTSTAQVIDNLTYTYASGQGNKLTKVEDAGTTHGFNNATNQTTEYNYDANGSLTEDKNKGISAIVYNFLSKPTQITFTDGRVITYTYDAAGTKLSMGVTQNSVTTTTDYVGGFVYQNNALSFFGSPEGRVVKNGSTLEYQYAIGDHQGNTRVLFTSATPAAQPVTADMEAATNSNFQNYPTGGNRSSFNLFDHTDAGTTYTYSQLLNGGNNSQVGVAKSYKVYPGDKVKIDAYAKYSNPTSSNSNLAGFTTALLSAFAVPAPGVGETGTVSYGLDSYGDIVAGGGGSGSPSGPKAFVNILIFDKNYNFLDIGYDQIDPSAQQVGASPVVAHDLLSREYTVKEEGYVFMYVSNENATQVDVYFDDVTMTYTPSNIIQYNEYYPFGLNTAGSWTRENTTGNNFQYNESTELNPSSGYYDLFFRNFDPVLGRFVQVDPLASVYHNQSTYQYGNNDPIFWSDPSGAGGDEAIVRRGNTFTIDWDKVGENGGVWQSDGEGGGNYQMFGSSMEAFAYGFNQAVGFGMTAGEARSAIGSYAQLTGSSVSYRNGMAMLTSSDYTMLGQAHWYGPQEAFWGGNLIVPTQEFLKIPGYIQEMLDYLTSVDIKFGKKPLDELIFSASTYIGAASNALLFSDEFRAGSNGQFVHVNGRTYSNRFYGNQHVSRYSVQASKLNTASTAKFLSKVSNGLIIASVAATVYDGTAKGWKNHHFADLAVTAGFYALAASVPVAGWIVGGVYFAADVTTQYYTGKSITENLFD